MIQRRYTSVSAEQSKSCADELIVWLRSYAERRINSRLIDERRCIPPHIVLDFANRGLLGLQVEKRYGGLALKNRDIARVLEQVAAIDLGLAAWLTTSIFPGIRPIAAYGNDALKGELLPLLARGRILGAYAQTESGAGSDFTKLATRAEPTVNGGWKLSGEKIWIGNGSWSGVMTVMAQVCNAEGHPTDMAAFAVRSDLAGVAMGEELLSMGMRGMVQSKIRFSDVLVDSSVVLGDVGEGLLVGVDSMMLTRFALGACAVGAMKRCLQLMHVYAERRSIGSGKLCQNPVYMSRFVELSAKTAGAEALLYELSDTLDSEPSVPLEPFVVCKMLSSEYLWEAADRLVQVLGARGYDEANLAPQLLRDARVFRIFEGPTEVLSEFLGSRALLTESPGVYGFLRNTLNSPEVADTVGRAVEKLKAKDLTATISDPNAQHAWRCALAGDIVAHAFTLGSLSRRREPTEGYIVEWAKAALTAAIARAEQTQPGSLPSAFDDTLSTRTLRAYEAAIGNVEQGQMGESRALDPLLRKTVASSAK